jgi:hypothetical protein
MIIVAVLALSLCLAAAVSNHRVKVLLARVKRRDRR